MTLSSWTQEVGGWLYLALLLGCVAAPLYVALFVVWLTGVGAMRLSGAALVSAPLGLMAGWLVLIIVWDVVVTRLMVGPVVSAVSQGIVQVGSMALIGTILVRPAVAVVVFTVSGMVAFVVLYWLYGRLPSPSLSE